MRIRFFILLATILAVSGAFAGAQDETSMPQEKTAVVLGQNIRYFDAGQGPAVILVHGLGASKEIWLRNFAAFSSHYHVYAIDEIGFGHSDKPLLEYRIATFVDFLYAFMRSQNLSKASLIGNSLGGWIAAEFAAQHPGMVDKLILVDAAGIAFAQGHAPTINLNPASLAATRKMMESIVYDKTILTDEFIQAIFSGHMRNNDGYTIQQTLAGFAAEDQFEGPKLESIHAPTLVLWGRQDALLTLSYGQTLQQDIPGSKMVVLEECGHIPEIEKPAEFNAAVLQFLGQ